MHIVCIVYNNVIIEEQSFLRFFYSKNEPGIAMSAISGNPLGYNIFNAYSKYTGAETGFGFYAPNVASDIILLQTTYDKTGSVISIATPKFHSKEAKIRYVSAMGVFMDKIDNHGAMHQKYLNAILKSIGLYTFNNNSTCRKVVTDLLVYDLPPANSIKNHAHASYLKLGHYEYNIK
ncbi:MAG: hypothetical protein BGO69_04805 [Bacteroidetes bacterium 46-16]|nr:MAG: hypothetical protein BGO69_04805 [Bacteroidetes bacterium 46-16]